MATGTDSSSTPAEISLVRGGPFYRAQQAVGLIRPNQWNLGRRIALLIAVGWLPLFLITALFNFEGLDSLLREYRIHSRMLIAVPVLLVGELLMESRFRVIMGHIRQADLLDASDLVRIDDLIATLVRVRDSYFPEFAILLLLFAHTATSYRGLVDAAPWLAHGSGADLHLTAAGWYAVVVSTSIFQFLLGLALWRWLLWTFVEFKFCLDNLNATKVQSSHRQSARPSKNWKIDVLTTTAYQPAAVKWRSAPDPCANHGAASTRPRYEVAV